MKKIKSINITFENCESYSIPYSSINNMNIEGFKERLFIHYNDRGECSKSQTAYSVSLIIKKTEEIKPFYEFSKPFFDRVNQYNDICYITINYEDGKRFGFYVPWDYSDEQYNSYQKAKYIKDSLHIDIRRKNKNI